MKGKFCWALLLLGSTLYLVVCSAALSTNSIYNRNLVVNGSNSTPREDCRCPPEGAPPEGATVIYANLTSALQAVANSTRVIIHEPQNHTLSLSLEFRWLHDVSLLGCGGSVSVTCEQNAGLSFVHSQRISVEGLEFHGCGTLHNSTSRDYNVTDPAITIQFLHFRSSLYFEFCQDVQFDRVTVSGSDGIGLVMYGTVGNNSFRDCVFSDNFARSDPVWGGGGVYVEFPFCTPGSPESCSKIVQYFNSTYRFTHCNFSKNVAYFGVPPIDYAYFYPQEHTHLSFGRGGGLCVYISNARNILLSLDSVEMYNNTAMWGGGLFVEFQASSYNNTFEMVDSNIYNNMASEIVHSGYNQSESKLLRQPGGGGARVGFLFFNDNKSLATNNHICFRHTDFANNTAYWGGGVSFGTTVEASDTQAVNTLQFLNCTWERNYAKIGAAVQASLMYRDVGRSPHVMFKDCRFLQNSDWADLTWMGGYVGTATLLAERVHVKFDGNTLFYRNSRTPLVIEEAIAIFLPNSVSNFTENIGLSSSAITTWGHAFVILGRETEIHFVDNYCTRRGGAITANSYSRHMTGLFGNCFLQYEDASVEPWRWKTHLFFKNNTHGPKRMLRSISTISFIGCRWHRSGLSNYTSSDTFCWNASIWDYDPPCHSDSSQITSFPAKYSNTSYMMSVFPGISEKLPVRMTDDNNNDATNRMILNVWSNSKETAIIDTSTLYTGSTDAKIKLHGKENSSVVLFLESNEPRSIITEVVVTLLNCPPGYKAESVYSNSPSERVDCVCNSTSYLGNVNCIGGYSVLTHGWWLGLVDGIRSIVATPSPFVSKVDSDKQAVHLPKDNDELDHFLCSPLNRTGVGCGVCVPGFGLSLHDRLRSYQCIPCSANHARYAWFLVVLVNFVPTTIFFIILWLTRFNATSGPTNAFIFFAHVIPEAYSITNMDNLPIETIKGGSIIEDIYVNLYDIWSLTFLRGVFPDFCIHPNFDTLDHFMLDYLSAFFPLVLIVIFLVVSNFKHNSLSVLDAIRTFIVLSYSKIILVTDKIMTPSYVYDFNGSHVATYIYHGGNIPYWTGKHIAYGIFAILVTIFFVLIPLFLLIAYPIAGMLGFSKPQNWLAKISRGKLPLFLEGFYGCYKDRATVRSVQTRQMLPEIASESPSSQLDHVVVCHRDYRYTAGLYLLVRFIVFSCVSYTRTWMETLIGMQIISVMGVLYFTVLRPYKDDFYNLLDSTTFAVLAILSTLTSYNVLLNTINEPMSSIVYYIQSILIFLPMAWTSVGFIWMIRKKFTKCFRLKTKTEDDTESSSLGDGKMTARLIQDHPPCVNQPAEESSLETVDDQHNNRAACADGSIHHAGESVSVKGNVRDRPKHLSISLRHRPESQRTRQTL